MTTDVVHLFCPLLSFIPMGMGSYVYFVYVTPIDAHSNAWSFLSSARLILWICINARINLGLQQVYRKHSFVQCKFGNVLTKKREENVADFHPVWVDKQTKWVVYKMKCKTLQVNRKRATEKTKSFSLFQRISEKWFTCICMVVLRAFITIIRWLHLWAASCSLLIDNVFSDKQNEMNRKFGVYEFGLHYATFTTNCNKFCKMKLYEFLSKLLI